jgi:hypothetical protein
MSTRTPEYLEGTEFEFYFTADSVKVILFNWTDHSFDPGCPALEYYEYTIGSYTLTDQVLTIDGVFTDHNYNVKLYGCYGVGEVHPKFDIYKECDQLIMNIQPMTHPDFLMKMQRLDP